MTSPDPGGPRVDSGLSGVVATSASSAWAAGSTANGKRTLILRWNGTAWTQVPSPSPDAANDGLIAVAASSAANLWAVGTFGSAPSQALAIHCC